MGAGARRRLGLLAPDLGNADLRLIRQDGHGRAARQEQQTGSGQRRRVLAMGEAAPPAGPLRIGKENIKQNRLSKLVLV